MTYFRWRILMTSPKWRQIDILKVLLRHN